MEDYSWIDYLILGIFFLSILAGLARGLVKELISLITLIAAVVIAALFANPLAVAFTNSSSVQNAVDQSTTAMGVSTAQPVSYAALGLSFAALFVGTMIVGAIVGLIINLAMQAGGIGFGNRLLGGVFGLCRGFMIILVFIFLVQLTSFATDDTWQKSRLVAKFQPAVEWLGSVVSPTIADLKSKVGDKLGDMNSTINSALPAAPPH